MIKVVSFDIGGTLIKSTNTSIEEKTSLKELYKLIDIPSSEVKTAYKEVFQKMKGNFNTLTNEFFRRLNIEGNQELIDFFKLKFCTQAEYGNISENDLKVINKLKHMGYKVIFFSNSCCLLNNCISKKIRDIIDGIFYSFELGYTKNENGSYKFIEEKLNNKPEEFLHIGDTLSSDYTIPINNGWNALYYGKSEDKEIKSISNLEEVFNFL